MNIDLRAKRRFMARAALQYREAAYLDHAVADELDERLKVIKMVPGTILNCGARDEYSAVLLQHRYPDASIFSMDLNEKSLASSPSQMALVGEAEYLPIQNASVDLLFSNLMLHSVNDFQKTLLEFRRVLKPNGLLFFSMLGRDTLKELRKCFINVSPFPHIHDYFDMHDVGDSLLKNQFLDPVMDAEEIEIQFSSPIDLIRDIRKSGQCNAHIDRREGLMGKTAWKKMLEHYDYFRSNQAFPATFEIIYGHAWAPAEGMHAIMHENGEVAFPLHLLKTKK
jgi:malonyl-CoA O-methyltransferase